MDHVGGVEYLSKLLKIPFYMHENEEHYIENDNTVFGNIRKADGFLKEDTKLNIGNLDIKVIHTPGHTQGGVCFLVDGKLFSGDTLFQGSIGRTDFPGGDMNTILSSTTSACKSSLFFIIKYLFSTIYINLTNIISILF